MQEAEAVARLQRGDWSGLEVLVHRYQVPAVRAAQLVTRDRALAEDVVQEAFLRLLHDIASYDPSRPFAPWFLRLVVRDAVRVANKAMRNVPLPVENDEEAVATFLRLVSPVAGPEERLQQGELEAAVRMALDSLSPSQRAAVILRYYLGLDEAAMADVLHCRPGTVKWHLHRARQRLAPLLRPLFNGR